MTLSRRSLLAAGATGTLALTAGCLDFVLGNGPLELEADRAAPSDDALAETGYEENTVEQQELDETISVADVERDVRASVWASLYAKEQELAGTTQEASLFAAISLPAVEVAGRSFNPLEEMSNKELLEEMLSQFESSGAEVENISHEESFGLDILGDGREVDVFVGETDYNGQTIDVEISLTSLTHEDDMIVLLGSHPQPLAEESSNVELLMESVEHPV